MAFLDDLSGWTGLDAAVLSLGRTLGVFSASTDPADAKAVLLTNNAAGNTLYGMLDRLVWLGVLERDDETDRYRAAPPRLHPLTEVDDVPALVSGPPARSFIHFQPSPAGFTLEADRAGFRHLSRVFEEIANSGLQGGWQVDRNQGFASAGKSPALTLRLLDESRDDAGDEPGELSRDERNHR